MSDLKQANVLTAIAQPSDDLKTLIADHRDDLAQTRAAIELYTRQAERAHPRSITGGLLAAMAGEAANDPISAKHHQETINDVDYLSTSLDESVPHIDDVLAYPNWLSESVPQITDADMQLIFIKNLSEILIQRMHSMDRFSEDDYAIGGGKLMPWDIVIGQWFTDVEDESEQDRQDEFAIVTGKRKKLSSPQHDHFDVLVLSKANVCEESTKIGMWASIYHGTNDTYRAITEAELPAFRAALEACYA